MDADPSCIRRLYRAMAARDGDAMAACYSSDARFADPVFPDLRGPEVGAMWRMLVGRARDLRVTAASIECKAGFCAASWEARYTFTATGRPVHNVGQARFALRDGLITQHVDSWDFHGWAGQALGWKGKMFGWSRPLESRVQREAAQGLERFMAGPGRAAAAS